MNVASRLASHYAAREGNLWSPQSPGHDAGMGRAVARWYESPQGDPTRETRQAYAALAECINRQYDTLAAWFTVTVSPDDPYADASELFSDLDQGILKIFATGDGDHPLWSPQQNDRFRAVHDVFGHYASRVPFCRNGEDAAYRSHALTFPTDVLSALATETRAQNSALVYGRNAGTFAEQTATLSPEWVWRV